ncbi:hypothetical protein RJT34_32643 [Clitoria ternatea]|uniref:CLAVATA3/ESR (CLE)-related protein 13 n=1 Tax=Clitoria ternatea TaxID=43366 RepID=A0AAN9I3Z2_CLITE
MSSTISYACLAPSRLVKPPPNIILSSSLSLSLSLHAIIPISFHFLSHIIIMGMIIKVQHLLSFILWLFLFLILFSGWFCFNSNDDTNVVTTNNQPLLYVSRNRKLATVHGFDFTPFHHHHHRHHHQHHHHRNRSPQPKETEIDPRYGVDKRLVPTGPNPLHH